MPLDSQSQARPDPLGDSLHLLQRDQLQKKASPRVDRGASAHSIIALMGDSPSHDAASANVAVQRTADQTTVTVSLGWPAEHCYRLFADADRIAQWLYVVGTVVVRSRDASGRALEVDFMGSLERASVSYTLLYEYDNKARLVRWRYKSGSLKQLAGSARFESVGESACIFHYSLVTELPKHLPQWSDQLYRIRPAETVVIDFREWLDSLARPAR
jgi:hypothetical protein